MRFLGNLGIDIKLLIAQMINFALLLWILSKLVYKPLVRKIEEDEAELEQAENKTKELEKEKNDFENQKVKELAESRRRAAEIISEAEDIAKQIKKRSSEETEKEKEAVISQIKTRLSEINDEKRPKK